MFGLKIKRNSSKNTVIQIDRKRQKPAVRKSICTGEATGGYIDLETGKFHEWMLLPDAEAIRNFCRELNTEPEALEIIY